MGKPVDRPRGEKLNQHLCVDDFRICVPQSCQLFDSNWGDGDVWLEHVKNLYRSIHGKEMADCSTWPTCYSCYCSEEDNFGLGWVLEGDLAVEHACQVHEKIHRQILALDQVSAIDVGFAISERQRQFERFLAIRVHVNKKMPPEQLLRAGLANLTQATFALGARDFRSRQLVETNKTGEAETPPAADGDAGSGPCGGSQPTCNEARRRHIDRLFRRAFRQDGTAWREALAEHYPISGISPGDLSLFCPKRIEETRSLKDLRLCICGVPIDIINASYQASITHPGGDADSGTFVQPPTRSDQLSHDEVRLIGRGRVNPLVGGVSVGTVTGQAGTLGTIVWDRTDATPCILSNWHVLAGTPAAQVGQPIYQPALFDGGTENDRVAHLKRWHLGEEGDAALGELDGSRHYAAGQILGLWNPVSGCISPRLNLEVRKLGRTTVFTEGFIDGICLATNIDYGNEVVRYFRNQFHIAPLFRGEEVSQVGDSGSLVVTRYKPVEQQARLDLLFSWLRTCCEACSCQDLRASILEGLAKLKEEAQQNDCETLERFFQQALQELNISESLKGVLRKIEDGECSDVIDFQGKEVKRLQEDGACPEAIRILNELRPVSCDGLRGMLVQEIRALEGTESDICGSKCTASGETDQLSEFLAGLLSPPSPSENGLSNLYQEFRETKGKLQNGEDQLKVLYELCRDCRIEPTSACKQAQAIIDSVADLLAMTTPFADLGNCAEPDPLTLCGRIQSAAEVVEKERWAVARCAGIAADGIERIEGWLKNCRQIDEAQENCDLICKSLFQVVNECPQLKDRLALIEKIKEGLEPVSEPAPEADGVSRKQLATTDPIRSQDSSTGNQVKVTEENFLQMLQAILQDNQGEKWFLDVIEKALRGGPFIELLQEKIADKEVLAAWTENVHDFLAEQEREANRETIRANYAVGLIFAGDTPGSPFGEFAIASDIQRLSEKLRFSTRPVYEPRSSFRELRVRPDARSSRLSRRGSGGLTPGESRADERPGGPQPEVEPLQSGSGSGG